MSDSFDSGMVNLAELARRLLLEGMPVQKVIAAEAGVSQPTVSRAIRRRIKSSSRGARKLWEYAEKRAALLDNELPQPATSDAGATESSPPSSSDSRPARRRASPLPHHRPRGTSPGPAMASEQLAEAAMSGLREYLADEFDPQLVIEQLAVLRRAQDPARKRMIRSEP